MGTCEDCSAGDATRIDTEGNSVTYACPERAAGETCYVGVTTCSSGYSCFDLQDGSDPTCQPDTWGTYCKGYSSSTKCSISSEEFCSTWTDSAFGSMETCQDCSSGDGSLTDSQGSSVAYTCPDYEAYGNCFTSGSSSQTCPSGYQCSDPGNGITDCLPYSWLNCASDASVCEVIDIDDTYNLGYVW